MTPAVPSNLKDEAPKPVAWVTGAGGLIGSQLMREAGHTGSAWRVLGLTRAQLDLTDSTAVRHAFHRDRPQLVIHCAALSQSPACQQDPPLAWRLNRDATAMLAELAAGIPLIFFSTDLVFDGRQGNYDENDRPNPLSVYAETKVAAERIVLANPRHTVIRTSLNGGTSPSGDRGFNEALRRAWQAGRTVKLFTDEFRSPIAAEVTARAVWEMAARRCTGLYHVAGGERLSRWQIGELVARRWGTLQPRVEADSLINYSGAPRAPDTSLNCARAQDVLSVRLAGLGEWLAAHPEVEF